jgi:drug/metabolite transporter (DMT)-like permease
MAEQTMSAALVYTFMGLMIITGSINTIANKLQQSETSLGISYEHHQWFITFCMFLGECTCLIGYLIVSRKKQQEPLIDMEKDISGNKINPMSQEDDTPKEAKVWYFWVPAMCDLMGSTLMTFGLTYLASSVYQMFRGILILFTAAFSYYFLKSKLYRQHYLGILLVVGGLAMVGLDSVLHSGSASKSPGVGIILVVIAQVFSATQFIVEEKLLKKYSAHPLRVVGWEGVWGSVSYIVILIIFQFVSCNSWSDSMKDGLCMENDSGNYKLEDTIFAFRQLGNNGLLLFYVLLYVCSIAVFNFVGISITKFVSSTARAVVDTVRTVIVWVFFLVMPFVPDNTKEKFSALQLCGFLVLIAGSLIYNEVVVLPFFGFNLFTKKALAEKKNNKEAAFLE